MKTSLSHFFAVASAGVLVLTGLSSAQAAYEVYGDIVNETDQTLTQISLSGSMCKEEPKATIPPGGRSTFKYEEYDTTPLEGLNETEHHYPLIQFMYQIGNSRAVIRGEAYVANDRATKRAEFSVGNFIYYADSEYYWTVEWQRGHGSGEGSWGENPGPLFVLRKR